MIQYLRAKNHHFDWLNAVRLHAANIRKVLTILTNSSLCCRFLVLLIYWILVLIWNTKCIISKHANLNQYSNMRWVGKYHRFWKFNYFMAKKWKFLHGNKTSLFTWLKAYVKKRPPFGAKKEQQESGKVQGYQLGTLLHRGCKTVCK